MSELLSINSFMPVLPGIGIVILVSFIIAAILKYRKVKGDNALHIDNDTVIITPQVEEQDNDSIL